MANTSTRIAPVLCSNSLKIGLAKSYIKIKHFNLLISLVSLRSQCFGIGGIGGNVTEMIAEMVVAKKLEITGHELLKTIHPHPTMSEAVMEAAAAAYDEVIHI